MAKEIMVPLDGTRFAEAALPIAIALARRDGARLRLVSVWRTGPPAEEGWKRDRESEEGHLDGGQLGAYLRELAPAVSGATGGSVEVELLEGPVDKVLPDWLAEADIDLAVMTTHARRPITRLWLRSVADHMVRKGHHPVLLIHPPSEGPEVEIAAGDLPHKILVPLDGSHLSEHALNSSLLVGEGEDDVNVVLFRVIPILDSVVPLYLPDAAATGEEAAEEARKEADSYLLETSRRVSDWASSVDTSAVIETHIADAILAAATERGVDLIAMATHGRGGAARAVLGSVADKVMRGAHVPVMLFPPGKEEAES